MMPQDRKLKKGWRNLIDDKEYKSDFSKPHRKAMMTTVFRSNAKLNKELYSTVKNTITQSNVYHLASEKKKIVLGIDIAKRLICFI